MTRWAGENAWSPPPVLADAETSTTATRCGGVSAQRIGRTRLRR
ncbi:hypothetical protein I547_6660 [Mycobacterium kansasii 824]|uniref:Uncharacterized protein n=1 Tax=Mycobacterium kansasii TaxID=1768 RepID=A0A1V3XCA5_MYCKA|nr:hypothetical protein I547_6660 [Mycobacterium kansasii 824]OOK76864.1 hypothetical protein BZL29_3373 [Mycobacterium kansasii]